MGLVLTCDLLWKADIYYTIKRVDGVLWQLKRFWNLGTPTNKLIKFFILKISLILMVGSICFHSSLIQELSQKLELHQRRSLEVIFGSQYRSCRHTLSLTLPPWLDILREEACLSLALRAQENPPQLFQPLDVKLLKWKWFKVPFWIQNFQDAEILT